MKKENHNILYSFPKTTHYYFIYLAKDEKINKLLKCNYFNIYKEYLKLIKLIEAFSQSLFKKINWVILLVYSLGKLIILVINYFWRTFWAINIVLSIQFCYDNIYRSWNNIFRHILRNAFLYNLLVIAKLEQKTSIFYCRLNSNIEILFNKYYTSNNAQSM